MSESTGQSGHDADITRALNAMRDAGESDEVLRLVYEQLRTIAEARMRQEKPGHTLQATALVHEAYCRLLGDRPEGWENRAHFFHAAAEAMRRILIDHARKRGAQKRGGRLQRLPMNVVDLAQDYDAGQVMQLDEALTTLESEDARAAEVVRLRFFAGLSVEETAQALGSSERTVMREWAFARARLFELLGNEGE